MVERVGRQGKIKIKGQRAEKRRKGKGGKGREGEGRIRITQ